MRVLLLMCACVSLGFANAAIAQDNWRAAVTGAAIYSTQDSQSFSRQLDPGVPQPAVGGSAPGLVVGAEIAMRPALGVGVEVSQIGRFETIQTTRGTFVSQTDNNHRDLIVSAVAFGHERWGARVTATVAGGFSFVQEDTTFRTATAPPGSSGPFGPYGTEQSATRNTYGGLVGFDLPISITSHLSFGPTFRAHFIRRAHLGDADPNAGLGLATAVFRAGVAARVVF